MRTVVFSNPNGRRVKRQLHALITRLSHFNGLEHIVTDNAANLDQIVSAREWCVDDLVVINGGDGTAQHVFTAFLKQNIETLPIFALLPGGTTNMTANSYNRTRVYKRSLTTLCKNLEHAEQMQTTPRCLVEVQLRDQKICGAFFGTGLIVQGIQYCHDFVYKTGMRSELGAGIALIRAAIGIARKQEPFKKATAVQIDDYPELPMLVLLVSSLDKLFLGMRPFWGKESGSLHLTSIMQGAVKFLKRLPSVIRGGKHASQLSQVDGYESKNLDQVTLNFDGPFTIDGELFDTQGQELVLSASRPLRFLSL